MDKKPLVYDFHGYREYLKAWLEFHRLSLRTLATRLNVTASFLSQVSSAKRKMTKDVYKKLMCAMDISQRDAKFFWHLVELADGDSIEIREKAFKQISSFREYKARYQQDLRSHQMLTAWHYMAIWQLAALPEFQADPVWIQKQFRFKISVAEVREALRFLIDQKFLIPNENGKIQINDQFFHANKDVLKLAMAHGHREFLELASQSIYNTPSAERQLLSYTVALPAEHFHEVSKALSETVEKVRSIAKQPGVTNSVYNVALYAFPLTVKPPGQGEAA